MDRASATASLFKPKSGMVRAHVSLVHPPTLTSADAYGLDVVPPLGLAYVATALKTAGHEVAVVDGMGEALHRFSKADSYPGLLIHGLTIEEVIGRIDPRSDVVGISSMFSNQWLFIRDLAKAIKKAFPRCLLVMGGEHVTACADYILVDCPEVDVCVLGEGEETIIDLVEAHMAGRNLQTVFGIVVRREKLPFHTPKRPRITAIDDIPEPDWTLIPIETYIDEACTYGVNVGRSMPMLASRGCPFECTFCSNPQMWTTRWVARSPEKVVEEMKKYIRLYRVTNFDFYDLTAIVKKQWIFEFCQLLKKENLKITYQLASGTRSEAIDQEIVKLLGETGCRLVIYAPESGSPEELDRIKKRVKPERMIESMRAAHRAGMETKANMIFGMLGATWKDVFYSFGFLFKMVLAGVNNVTSYPFSPYPGSEDFKTLVASGKIVMNDDYFRSLLFLCRNLHTKNTVSHNERFSASVLAMICSCAFVWFYSMNYLVRPWRPFQLLYTYFIRNEASSLLTVAFQNVRRKKAVARLLSDPATRVAEVPADLRLKNKLVDGSPSS